MKGEKLMANMAYGRRNSRVFLFPDRHDTHCTVSAAVASGERIPYTHPSLQRHQSHPSRCRLRGQRSAIDGRGTSAKHSMSRVDFSFSTKLTSRIGGGNWVRFRLWSSNKQFRAAQNIPHSFYYDGGMRLAWNRGSWKRDPIGVEERCCSGRSMGHTARLSWHKHGTSPCKSADILFGVRSWECVGTTKDNPSLEEARFLPACSCYAGWRTHDTAACKRTKKT